MRKLLPALLALACLLIPSLARADTNIASLEAFVGGIYVDNGNLSLIPGHDGALTYGGALTLFMGDPDDTLHFGWRFDGTFQDDATRDLFLTTGLQLDLEIPIANFILIPYGYAGLGYQFKKIPGTLTLTGLNDNGHSFAIALGGGAKIPLVVDFAYLTGSVVYYRGFSDNEGNNVRYVGGVGLSL